MAVGPSIVITVVHLSGWILSVKLGGAMMGLYVIFLIFALLLDQKVRRPPPSSAPAPALVAARPRCRPPSLPPALVAARPRAARSCARSRLLAPQVIFPDCEIVDPAIGGR